MTETAPELGFAAMPGSRGRIVALLLLLLQLVTPLAGGITRAQPAEPGWSLDRLEQSWPMAPDAALAVRNEWGDVRVRLGHAPEVVLSAIVQRRGDVEVEPAIEAVLTADGLAVEVRFAELELPPPLRAPGVRLDRRVDVTLFIPAGTRLTARTHAGLIEAKGLDGFADLQTVSGDVRLSTSAAARVATNRGAVLAAFRATDWARPARFESVTGDIRIELPTTAQVAVSLATEGEITTDYSLAIERSGRFKQGRATIGGGGQELAIHSRKGGVKIVEGLP